MAHDFNKFPELTNNQMQFYYVESPHRQITESFRAVVTNVHDGDSIKVRWEGRNFDFPVRLKDILAPELGTPQGNDAKRWLEKQILGEEVEIILDPKDRVDKWGRILGRVECFGMDINSMIVDAGMAEVWGGP